MLECEHIPRRVLPSHPDWVKLDELSGMICIATNFHCHPNGFETVEGLETTAPALQDIDRLALLSTLKEAMWKELHGGRFADFINSQEFRID
jgi:hypothetical protein